MIDWQIKPFSQLSLDALYDLLKARSDVFVVEQTCIYADMDDIDKDPTTFHLYGYQHRDLVGTCRILAPGRVYENQSAIGRVLITKTYRDQGLATTVTDMYLEDDIPHIGMVLSF